MTHYAFLALTVDYPRKWDRLGPRFRSTAYYRSIANMLQEDLEDRISTAILRSKPQTKRIPLLRRRLDQQEASAPRKEILT